MKPLGKSILVSAFGLVLPIACHETLNTDPDTPADSLPHYDSAFVTSLNSFRLLCLDSLNALRLNEGRPPLLRWIDGETCADSQARRLSHSGYADFQPEPCGERGQSYCESGESILSLLDSCLNKMEADRLDTAFYFHFFNATNPGFTFAACGFHQSDDGLVWGVQNYR